MLIKTLLISLKLSSNLKKPLISEIREKLLSELPDSQVHEKINTLLRDSGMANGVTFNNDLKRAEKLMQGLSEKDIRILTIRDDDYPERFKVLVDAPLILFAKGNLKALNSEKTIGVIGSRSVAEKIYNKGIELSAQLSEMGYMIVSGLAKGCDAAGHIGCLDAGGVTTAILPSSIESIYPKENRPLADRIVSSNGCLVTEYLPGQKLQRYHFIQRDRLQASLSDKLLVLQTGVTGGTIHTVNYAVKYNKKVYCYMPEGTTKAVYMEGNRMLVTEKKAVPINELNVLFS